MDNETDSSGIETQARVTPQEPHIDRLVRAAMEARSATGEFLPEMTREEARRYFFGRPVEAIRHVVTNGSTRFAEGN